MSNLSIANHLLSREDLLLRLEEAEETLRAIRSGEVDALVVSGAHGDQVFTLKDATLPYQTLIEEMNEGALTLTHEGMILYCNTCFAEMLGLPMETILGKPFVDFVIPEDQAQAKRYLEHRPRGRSKGELTLSASRGEVPVGISLKELNLDGALRFGMVISDLTERKQAESELERHRQHLEDLVGERTAQLETTNAQLLTEITERKRGEEALRENERLLQAIVDSSPSIIFLKDRDGKFLMINKPLETMLGMSRESLKGKTDYDIYPKEDAEYYRAQDRLVIESGKAIQIEELSDLKDGHHVFLANKFPLINSSGEIYGVGAISHDITERKQAEEERARLLTEVEKRAAEMDATISSMAIGLIVYNRAGKATRMNNVAKELFSQELFFNKSLEERARIIHWETEAGQPFPPEEIPVARALHGETIHNVIIAAPFPNRKIWISASAAPILTPDGQMLGVVASFIDMTERKQAEEALVQSEERFRVIASNTPDHILVQDRDLRYTVVINPQLGLTEQDMLGKTDHDFLAKEDATNLTNIKRKVLETGNLEHVQTSFISRDGTPEYFEGSYIPKRDIHGQIDGLIGYFRNVTKNKQAEVALRESEERLRAIYATMTEGIALHEIIRDETGKAADYRILQVNPAFERIIGIAREQAVGALASALYGTGEAPYLELYGAVAETGNPTEFETTFDPLSKSFHISVFSPASDKFATVFQDITERKQAEAELARLASFPEKNPNPIVELDYSGEVVYLNPKCRELFPEFPRSGFNHPLLADLEPLFQKFKAGELGKVLALEVKAGNAYYHQAIVNVHENGRIRIYNVDITRRKLAEETLLASEERYRTVIENALDAILVTDPSGEGRILSANPSACRLFGYNLETFIGLDRETILDTSDPNFIAYMTQRQHQDQVTTELTYKRKDGSRFSGELSSAYYQDANGERRTIAIIRDITLRKQAEETLARQAEDLRRSNTELVQFAYVASHDLQEPLRIMSSYSQLLEKRYKGRLDQDADDFINFIVEAAARMQKLITDLLAYSRVGRETTNIVEVDCNQVLRKLVSAMATTIESEGGSVTFDHLPVLVAHESSLIQLFQNLIGNALKFRGEQPPSIHISARQARDEWIFSVRDNGIGIEPQYRERIFMIFQRLHSRDKYPGTGIGLSICKKIVENLGGRIWVESEPGQGSTFTFTVPIRMQDTTLHA